MGMLVDGQGTVYALGSVRTGVNVLVEQKLTPAGADARGGINMTSLRNLRRTTHAPKQLIEFTPMKVTCFFDPVLITVYNAILGFNQLISTRFSDSSVVTDYGWLDKFQPHEMSEGGECLADCEFIFSGVPVNGQQQALAIANAFAPGNEILPVYIPPSGLTAAAWLASVGGH